MLLNQKRRIEITAENEEMDFGFLLRVRVVVINIYKKLFPEL